MSEWLMGGAFAVLVAMLVLLALVVKKLSTQLQELRAQLAVLEQQRAALQQQNQNDILAIGQRMLEADKLVRRFSARLDAMESNQIGDVQYGQLESLLSKGVTQQAEASSAEIELLSLLRRQQQGS